MKKHNSKKIMAVLLVAAVAMLSVSASSMDIDASLSASTNGISVTNDDFAIGIEPEVSLYFDGNNGLNTRVGWAYQNDISRLSTGIGYTYKDRLTTNLDMAIKAGFDYTYAPVGDTSRHGYGMYIGVDFSVDFLENWFVSFGVRDTMEFANTTKVGDLDAVTETGFTNNLVLPRISVGYTF